MTTEQDEFADSLIALVVATLRYTLGREPTLEEVYAYFERAGYQVGRREDLPHQGA